MADTMQFIFDELEDNLVVRDMLDSVVNFVDVGDAVHSLVDTIEIRDMMQGVVSQVEEIKQVDDELVLAGSLTDSVFDFTRDQQEVNGVMLHMVAHVMNPLSSAWAARRKMEMGSVEEGEQDNLSDREDGREAELVSDEGDVEEEEAEQPSFLDSMRAFGSFSSAPSYADGAAYHYSLSKMSRSMRRLANRWEDIDHATLYILVRTAWLAPYYYFLVRKWDVVVNHFSRLPISVKKSLTTFTLSLVGFCVCLICFNGIEDGQVNAFVGCFLALSATSLVWASLLGYYIGILLSVVLYYTATISAIVLILTLFVLVQF